MGLGNTEQKTWLSIVAGKVVKRVKEGTDGAISRTNKEGKTVHELVYDYIEGTLESVVTEDGDYGKQWKIKLSDVGDNYELSLPYSSRLSKAFLCILPNIDLALPIKIVPTEKEVDGKKQSGMFILQNEKPLTWRYTKDNKNGLPDMEQVTIKGQPTWDDTKQLVFLEGEVKKKMAAVPVKAAPVPVEHSLDNPDPESGLPF